MRGIHAVLVVALLSLCGAAAADLCPPCRGRAYTKDIGTCKACGGPTLSGQFKLCQACSSKARECEHCRAKLDDPAPPPPPDGTVPGSWKSGRWEYEIRVENAGSRSEGRFGDVKVDGKAVGVSAEVNDHLKTPWGLLYWVGDPPVAFGAHRWWPKPAPSKPLGRLLPDPAGSMQAVVWMTMLRPRPPAAGEPALDPWIAEALRAQGVKDIMSAGAAIPLGPEVVVLHDSKHYGRAEARLAREERGLPLVVEVAGTEKPTVELAYRDGEKRVVKHVLSSQFGPYDIWLALRVEVSAPPEPPPPLGGPKPPR